MRYLGILAVVSLILAVAATAQAITIDIDMVTVGNPGNAADMRYNLDARPEGYGAVAYSYNISKYEVTAGQYTAFLKAVGGVDTYALYNTAMDPGGLGYGITRSGGGTVLDPYTYAVAAGVANRPISKVSWGDAARFCNWMANGQPIGMQNASTTEDGSYYLNSAITDADLLLVTRKANATWALPTQDEWYKAAYYDPATGTYFDYPTSSNTAPERDMADASGNNANYRGSTGTGTPYPIDSPYDTTKVGEFQLSDSPYGTFDQGGNVNEWNEALYDSNTNRALRGGAFCDSVIEIDVGYPTQRWVNVLSAEFPNGNLPTKEQYTIGFRVSSPVPEPVTMAGLVLGIGSLATYLRKRK